MSQKNISSASTGTMCKIAGCECFKQEISLQMLYWLSHRGIDIKPLFEKPYFNRKRQVKLSVDTIISSNTLTSNEQNFTQTHPNVESSTLKEEMNYTIIPSHAEVSASNGTVLDEFLNWSITPNQKNELNNNSHSVRRSNPYKVPTSRRNV